MTNIPCVILAGGKSSRMGEDKSLLPFGQYPTLIQYQYKKLSKIFSDIYISSKTDKFDFEANIILDNNLNYSPMVALKSILDKFQGKVFIISVDTPLVDKSTIEELINKSNSYEITIAQDKEKTHNLCGVFDTIIINQIEQYLQQDIHKINYLIKNSNTQILDFDDSFQFSNLNTKKEYQKVCTYISRYNN